MKPILSIKSGCVSVLALVFVVKPYVLVLKLNLVFGAMWLTFYIGFSALFFVSFAVCPNFVIKRPIL